MMKNSLMRNVPENYNPYVSSDDYKNDKSLKGEFIRLVLSKDELGDDEKAAIIECGIRALAGDTV